MPIVEPPFEPMLARMAGALPLQPGISYEPKWDGFRCLIFRSGDTVDLRSRNHRALAPFFPEIVEAVLALPDAHMALDGELVVVRDDTFSFGALMGRVDSDAPVDELAVETPTTFIGFDALSAHGCSLLDLPFVKRRHALEGLLARSSDRIVLSPTTRDPVVAASWLERAAGSGIDGVVAKEDARHYAPGRRAMTKVKIERTADCVVAGFRMYDDASWAAVSALLLGVYAGGVGAAVLQPVGIVNAFDEYVREQLAHELAPYAVLASAAASDPYLDGPWIPLAPELVCEVAFDQVDGTQFRHAARWRRWRFDRDPLSCRIEQLAPLSDDPARILVG